MKLFEKDQDFVAIEKKIWHRINQKIELMFENNQTYLINYLFGYNINYSISEYDLKQFDYSKISKLRIRENRLGIWTYKRAKDFNFRELKFDQLVAEAERFILSHEEIYSKLCNFHTFEEVVHPVEKKHKLMLSRRSLLNVKGIKNTFYSLFKICFNDFEITKSKGLFILSKKINKDYEIVIIQDESMWKSYVRKGDFDLVYADMYLKKTSQSLQEIFDESFSYRIYQFDGSSFLLSRIAQHFSDQKKSRFDDDGNFELLFPNEEIIDGKIRYYYDDMNDEGLRKIIFYSFFEMFEFLKIEIDLIFENLLKKTNIDEVFSKMKN